MTDHPYQRSALMRPSEEAELVRNLRPADTAQPDSDGECTPRFVVIAALDGRVQEAGRASALRDAQWLADQHERDGGLKPLILEDTPPPAAPAPPEPPQERSGWRKLLAS